VQVHAVQTSRDLIADCRQGELPMRPVTRVLRASRAS
jgi:hypothetical protein